MDPVGLASDARSLNQVRRAAGDDPSGTVRAAANEFEALFTRQLLKSMRQAMPRAGLFDGPGTSTYESMLDDQLSRQIVGRKGGLGDILARHLSRYMSDGPAPITIASGMPAVTEPSLQVQSDQRIAMSSLPSAIKNALVTGAPLGDGDAGKKDFVSRLWPHARLAQTHTGVPAEFVIGQAALESGWGRAEMRHPDGRPAHNLFGIKASANWQGETVDVVTTEYIDGKRRQQVETFRAYGSYAESFSDWVSLMKGLPRYASVLKEARTAKDFAEGLQSAGYATDPKYSTKLRDVIRQASEIRDAINTVPALSAPLKSARADSS